MNIDEKPQAWGKHNEEKMKMEAMMHDRQRLLGTSNTTLDDAIRAALGVDHPLDRDDLNRYEVVAVRGIVKGRMISFWQVILKPRFSSV